MKTTETNFAKKLSKTMLMFTAIVWLTCASNSKAQNNFTIPDANFAAWLTANIPSAMSGGNLMDTTSTAVTTLTRMIIENKAITDLSGIQYFTSLLTLDCSNDPMLPNENQLTGLSALPGSLDSLICNFNQLTSIAALPGSLTVLDCRRNALTSLPALPASMRDIMCSENGLTSLPALPSALVYLDCSKNQITSLPVFPASLTSLGCNENQLTALPALPAGLKSLSCRMNLLANLPALPNSLLNLDCGENMLSTLPAYNISLNWLDCSSNLLTSLPALNDSLQYFHCNNNQLTSLPPMNGHIRQFSCNYNQLTNLPALDTTLENLWCYNNLLTSLPTLPASLHYIECQYNQLTSFPTFSVSLSTLNCSNNLLTSLPSLSGSSLNTLLCDTNNISCFTAFPDDMYYLSISGNPFTCLPNYIPIMDAGTLAFPLCLPSNPNSCTSAQGIVGYTFKDMNSNCAKDNGDQNLVNIPMQIYDSGNNLLSQTYTASNGVYSFSDTAGTFTVLVDTTGMPFEMQCSYPGLDSTVTVVGLDTNVNFSLNCTGIDVGIQSVVSSGMVFPGQPHSLSIVAGDMTQWYNLNCGNGASGTVQITVSGPVTYTGPAAGALTPSVSGNVFTYTIADFGAITNISDFNLEMITNTSAQANDTICVYATVTLASGIDNNMSNNSYSHCYQVVNSLDPNMKEVYPVDVAPGYDGWFTYTIHFQNTGSAAAINILLKDSLDSDLDVKTFQVINYSHKNVVSLTGNLLEVRFPSINLPDSTSDLAGSKGFVQYRVKPKGNLPTNSIIFNTANIYFDFNQAVVTNTTINRFRIPTSVAELAHSIADVSVYPNPFSDNTTFIIKSDKTNEVYSFEMLDVLGKTVKSLYGISTKQFQVSRAGLESGIYFYKIYSATSIVGIGKVVIK